MINKFFKIFKKKSTQDVFRSKVRDVFEESVKNAKKQSSGNMLFDDMIIQAAIGNAREALLAQPELQLLGLSQNWIPEAIIDEECKRVMNKYLQ